MLNTILCQMQLKGTLTEEQIKDLIKTTTRPKRVISVKHVITRIAEFYNIDEASMYAKTRRREIVKPRQIIMFILRQDFHLSYPAIGSGFGRRGRTTVIHACEKVRGDIEKDDEVRGQIEEIRSMLK